MTDRQKETDDRVRKRQRETERERERGRKREGRVRELCSEADSCQLR